jgi:4a-hydroxytetrahydrobiopterin dehydratase
MTALIQERCVACRKDSTHVTDEEMTELQLQVPEWNIVEHNQILCFTLFYESRN